MSAPRRILRASTCLTLLLVLNLGVFALASKNDTNGYRIPCWMCKWAGCTRCAE